MAPLGQTERETLADALGDTPETVIAVHLLRRGLCRTYVSGDAARPAAVLVQPTELMSEPIAYGDDAGAIWNLLSRVDGWFCVNVSVQIAGTLGPLMERALGRPVRYYGDVHHTLTGPARIYVHDAVRRLTPEDAELVGSAPAEIRGAGFGSVEAMLTEGIAAGAVVDGKLAAIAHTSACTPVHADIGVATLEPWRGLGFSTAAASLVARAIQQTGRVPVWSCGEDNDASLRVARKLGFTEVSRRTYVVEATRQVYVVPR